MHLQGQLDQTARDRWAELGSFEIAAPLYFHGLAVLLRMLRTRPVGRRIRQYLDPLDCANLTRPFDRLGVNDRACLMGAAAALLHDWPDAFQRIGRRVELRSADLTDLGLTVPYWLQHPLQRFDRTWYQPHAREQASAREVLERRAGINAASIVREWLGAFASKPTIRSRMQPLDAPSQLSFAWQSPAYDQWLRQSLVERLCRSLRRHVRSRAYRARPAGRSARQSSLL